MYYLPNVDDNKSIRKSHSPKCKWCAGECAANFCSWWCFHQEQYKNLPSCKVCLSPLTPYGEDWSKDSPFSAVHKECDKNSGASKKHFIRSDSLLNKSLKPEIVVTKGQS
jgi:hypothetical protein